MSQPMIILMVEVLAILQQHYPELAGSTNSIADAEDASSGPRM
ncbi:MAG: hypothetical protein ACNA71_03565 [Kiritimatiellia bacterium]